MVLIIDDHPMYSVMLKMYLKKHIKNTNFKEMINPKSIHEINDFISSHPEIKMVLLDLKMPHVDCIQVLEFLNLNFPAITVLINTAMEDLNYISRIKSPNIRGIIHKSGEIEETFLAIKKVLSGSTYYSSLLTDQVNIHNEISLNDIELKIVQLLRKGYTQNEIATILDLKRHEVEYRRKTISKKTNTKNLIELEHYCIANRISA